MSGVWEERRSGRSGMRHRKEEPHTKMWGKKGGIPGPTATRGGRHGHPESPVYGAVKFETPGPGVLVDV